MDNLNINFTEVHWFKRSLFIYIFDLWYSVVTFLNICSEVNFEIFVSNIHAVKILVAHYCFMLLTESCTFTSSKKQKWMKSKKNHFYACARIEIYSTLSRQAWIEQRSEAIESEYSVFVMNFKFSCRHFQNYYPYNITGI